MKCLYRTIINCTIRSPTDYHTAVPRTAIRPASATSPACGICLGNTVVWDVNTQTHAAVRILLHCCATVHDSFIVPHDSFIVYDSRKYVLPCFHVYTKEMLSSARLAQIDTMLIPVLLYYYCIDRALHATVQYTSLQHVRRCPPSHRHVATVHSSIRQFVNPNSQTRLPRPKSGFLSSGIQRF